MVLFRGYFKYLVQVFGRQPPLLCGTVRIANIPPAWAGGKGAVIMNIAMVLRVFCHSSLVTKQGEYKISRIFPSGTAAVKARYRYYCTVNGIPVYARRTQSGAKKFAVIG
jgi:hypothetical protein